MASPYVVNPIHSMRFLAELCETYSIDLNAEQYVLVGSTIKSCLSYLKDEGGGGVHIQAGKDALEGDDMNMSVRLG